MQTAKDCGLFRFAVALLMLFAPALRGQQGCPPIRFRTASEVALLDATNSEITAGLLMPNYFGVTGHMAPPYGLVQTYSNFLSVLLPCVPNPSAGSLGDKAPLAGGGSQLAFVADLTGHGGYGVVGAALTGVIVFGFDVLKFSVTGPTMYHTGSGPVGVTIGDLNGDGKPDLVAVYQGASANSGGVSVLLGNGDGTFQAAVNYTTGSGSSAVAIADLNGDGKADLAVLNPGSNTVSILLGKGDGTFHAGTTISLPAAPYYGSPGSVTIADLNADGKQDLIVSLNGAATVFLGRGDGTFGSASPYAVQNAVYAAVADFNGDGKYDIAVDGTGKVTILLGAGDGTFTVGSTYAIGSGLHLVIADVNNDGNADILEGYGTDLALGPSYPSGVASVLLGNGDGTFQGAVSYDYFSPGAAGGFHTGGIGDFNGDGKPDLVAGDQSSLHVFLNNGNGTFRPLPALDITGNRTSVGGPFGFAIGDFNRDGKLDISIVDRSVVLVLLGKGDGTFGPVTAFQAGPNPVAIVAADFDGDGNLDLAVANRADLSSGQPSVSVLLGKGDGTFQPAVNYPAGVQPFLVTAADFNGDGKPDLAVGNAGIPPAPFGNVSILINNGDGTFKPAVNLAAGAFPQAMAAGDVNGDGKADLVVATQMQNFSQYSIELFLGNGDGTFQQTQTVPTASSPSALAIGDFNGDGKADLLIDHTGGDVTAMAGNGNGTFQAEFLYAGGSGYWLGVADFNGDGKPDFATADGFQITVALASATAAPTFSSVSAASYAGSSVAPDSLVAGFGSGLAPSTLLATTIPLPTVLNGTQVQIIDSAGASVLAPLVFVSAGQIDYLVPSTVATGTGMIQVTNNGKTVAAGPLQVSRIAPGIFTANSNGQGVPAAQVLVVSGGKATYDVTFEKGTTAGTYIPKPIDLSQGNVYLQLYGTGIRNLTGGTSAVTATVGGVDVKVLFAGAQPSFAGLDQVNIGPLPSTLAGKGTVNLVLTLENQPANIVDVAFK